MSAFPVWLVRVLLCVASISGWLLASDACAQPFGRVVVVPYGLGEPRASLVAADALEAELNRRRGAVISMHDARDRFVARSRPPLTASASDLDVLAAQANEALQHVAFGRTAAAQRSVQEVVLRAERTLESLNRETVRARQILDACLALVRGALHEKRRDEALTQAMRCRRLVPDLAPSEQVHPANVVGVLAEADDLLRRMRTGRLSVVSQPSSCSVYLNGRHLGMTPFLLDRAAAGEYRVQVECAQSKPARVHVVQLGDAPTELLVDTRFDAAVESDPRLQLHYEGEAELRAQSASHGLAVGSELGAEDVVLVRVVDDHAQLTRVRVQQGRVVARTRAAYRAQGGFAAGALSDAVVALIEGRDDMPAEQALTVELPAAPVVALPSAPVAVAASAPAAPPSQTAASREPARGWRRPTGITLAVAAALFAGIGLGLDVWAHSLEDDLVSNAESQSLSDAKRADGASAARWLGVAAAPAGVAAVALLSEPRERLPWWSYALAGVGLGAAGYAVYEFASSGDCKLQGDGVCLREKQTIARGSIVLAAAAPLLSVPVVQLIKRSRLSAMQVQAGVRHGAAGVVLRAAF